MTLICSELPRNSHNSHLLAIPDKNSTLTWSNKDEAVLAIIDIDVGCDIEDEI